MATNIYDSAKNYFDKPPGHITREEDRLRVQAYRAYENIYHNVPNSFKLVQRGDDSNPIYLPSARKIVESANRFFGKHLDFVLDPKAGMDADRGLVQLFLENFLVREEFYTKYVTQKRYGQVRGDFMWYLVGDDTRPEGRRISLYELDPGDYFPIYEDGDYNKVIGCHIVQVVTHPKDSTKTAVRRQTFRKLRDENSGVVTITSELAVFESDKWDDRIEGQEIVRILSLKDEEPLDPLITSIPVYHYKNKRISNHGFGSSELQGIETVIQAVNQAVSDQELALAFGGLGVYWTNSGPPVDENNEIVAWEIGPGRMIEVKGDKIKVERLSGVDNIDSSLAHINFLLGEGQESLGIPAIASGAVDVQIAESGIALWLRMAPLLAQNEEKEDELRNTHDHFFYDLINMWFPVYEGIGGIDTGLRISTVVDDPMPVDKDAEIARVSTMVNAGLMSIVEARAYLVSIGVGGIAANETGEFDAEEIIAEQKALAEAKAFDPFANRFNDELPTDTQATGTGPQGVKVVS